MGYGEFPAEIKDSQKEHSQGHNVRLLCPFLNYSGILSFSAFPRQLSQATATLLIIILNK